jgi:hypothetical protein
MRMADYFIAFGLGFPLSIQIEAHAQVMQEPQNPTATAQGLYEFCSAKEWMLNQVCEYFIMGVGDVMGAQGRNSQTAPPAMRAYLHKTSLCTGTERYVPSAGAMVKAFMNWEQKHPEAWDYAMVVGVTFALSETWPCPK